MRVAEELSVEVHLSFDFRERHIAAVAIYRYIPRHLMRGEISVVHAGVDICAHAVVLYVAMAGGDVRGSLQSFDSHIAMPCIYHGGRSRRQLHGEIDAGVVSALHTQHCTRSGIDEL